MEISLIYAMICKFPDIITQLTDDSLVPQYI